MSVLKFKVLAEVVSKEVEIADDIGNVIIIPSKGFSDYQEYKQAMGRFLKVQANPNLAASIETDIVLVCLRCRLLIDPKTSDEEILQLENGELIKASMVKNLFKFFTKELGIESLMPKQPAQMEDATPYIEQGKAESAKGSKKSKLIH